MASPRLNLPSLNALYTFEATARRGSFARASDELNVTPAAVSRMIARLEAHLNLPLMLREPGGLRLTEDGAILHRAVSRGLGAIAAALQEIEERRHGIEVVSISISTGFTTHWLMPRMARFNDRFPDVELRFQLIMGALSGPVDDVDFGMRFRHGPDERHDAAYIMPEILVPVCSAGFAATEPRISLPLAEAWEGLIPSDPHRGWSEFFFTPGGHQAARSQMHFSDYAIIVQAALLGQGVALGWLNVVSHWLSVGSLIPAIPVHHRTKRRCQFINLRDQPLRPVARAVRDWLIAEMRLDMQAVRDRFPELSLPCVADDF